MRDQQLMQRVLVLVRDPHVAVAVAALATNLRFALFQRRGGREPAEVLAEAEDVRVDCEGGALEAEEGDAGGGLGADAGELEHACDGVGGGELVQVVEGDDAIFGVPAFALLCLLVGDVEDRLDVL